MSLNGVLKTHFWLDTSKTRGKFLHKRLEQYLESKKEENGFPFVIFSDHIPSTDELGTLPGSESLYSKKPACIILAINKKNSEDHSCEWDLLANGIDDVVHWDNEEEIISYLQSKHERNIAINNILESPIVTDNLVGNSIVWKKFLSEIIEAILFSQTSISLIGESGTGKELISRLIHAIDTRPDKKKLTVVDCTTIVPELSGSELFGHERGSYTNAIQTREGAFALANGGTLFLDEVGELPLNLQAELLRVLQEGTFKKVGSNTWQKASFRLVCATNKNLRKAVEEGRFRQDLYFRIADFEFLVPSLEKRRDDIALLATHFLTEWFANKECPEIDKPVMDYLVQREYPGNVRELKQLVHRMAMKHVRHKKITIGEIPESDRLIHSLTIPARNVDGIEDLIRKALLTGEDWWNLKNKISETAIRVALDLENNNKQKAAERLGVDVRTVQQYVKKSGV